jgi:cysteinyl-tRNA synthetase
MHNAIERKIQERNKAKRQQEHAKAREIENELGKYNIELTDNEHGTEWSLN